MMISIPSCGDNQIILMVKQTAIDLKYYRPKGGRNVAWSWSKYFVHIYIQYIKHFF